MTTRFIRALPALVGAVALGLAAQSWPLSLLLGAVISAFALLGPRLELDVGRQWLTSVIGAGAGYVGTSLLFERVPLALTEGWTRLAAAAFVAAAARFSIVNARGGYMPSFALIFFGVVVSGRTNRPGYGVLVALFLLASLWAFAERTELGPSRVRMRRVGVALLLLGMASGIGIGSTLGLRKLHAWASQRSRHTAFVWKPQVGFSDSMDLGALDDLLDSDERVLRLKGPRVDYLRGAVLTEYEAGAWKRTESTEREAKLTLNGQLPSQGVVEIDAVSESTGRFFIPLEAQHIATTPASVLVDPLGVVRRDGKQGLVSVRFLPGVREQARLAAPSQSDLQIPRRLRPRLEALASNWTRGKLTAVGKVRALEDRLASEYRYSRAFTRPSGPDPVMDFLFHDKRGHCEYFASALALLTRAAGVPARVAMGYRVGEHSPFGYYVVRQRNAHAWVEAWLPGSGWSTRDATPEEGLPQNQEHAAGYATSGIDAIGMVYAEATDWLEHLTLVQTSVAWLIGALVLAAIVARQARRRARSALVPPDEAPLPFMLPLLRRLASAGHARRADEPLERFAARVPDAASAQLLCRYAALRYGSRGNADTLAQDVAAEARSSKAVPPG